MEVETLYKIYIPVILLYIVFFILSFSILFAPEGYINYLLFSYVIRAIYHFYAILLIPLSIIIYLVIFHIRSNMPLDRRQIWRILIIPLIILAIFIFIYFFLSWMIPTLQLFYEVLPYDID